jgi:signal transduction histidine kinase/ligand-binding sensor domain-containing protein
MTCYRTGHMRSAPPHRSLRTFLLSSLIACTCAAGALAQDAPVVTYTTKDGLPHDSATDIIQDSRGFLWIGGPTALTRFDGERFTVYGRADGLDVGTGVNALWEGSHDDLWIATNGAGIFRLDLASPGRGRQFTQFRIGESRAANRVNIMKMLPDGRVWAGTDAGLFVGSTERGFRRVELPLPPGDAQDAVHVTALAIANDSWIWIGTVSDVYGCPLDTATGCIRGPSGRVRALLLPRDGRLWIGTDQGVRAWRLAASGVLADQPEVIGSTWRVTRLVSTSTDLLVGTEDGRVISLAGGVARVLFTPAAGDRINAILEDRSGNVWIATRRSLFVVVRQGVTLYSNRPGLQPSLVIALRRDPGGRVYAVATDQWLHRIDGDRVASIKLGLPRGVGRSTWPGASIHVDRTGDVWLGTNAGLYRYRNPAFSSTDPAEIRPSDSYTTANGLAGDHVTEIFEDSKGALWIASIPGQPETLTRWSRERARFEVLGAAQGLPAFSQPITFVEDRHGGIWARLREGGVVRIRNGHASLFGVEQGFPPLVTAVLADRDGKLWFGGADLVVRVADPAAEIVRAVPVLEKLGATVTGLAQDRAGVIFVGTYEGLIAFDPVTDVIRRFSVVDGLPRGSVEGVMDMSDGSLLVVAARTLVRIFPPALERPRTRPRCFLAAVHVGGRPLAISEWGVERVAAFDVPPSENQIEIELVGLSQRLGEPLTYEYRIPGISDEWRRAASRRVTYAGLAPGRYTFEARTATLDGSGVSAATTMTFRVLPPWYRRWWFLSLLTVAGLFVAYAAHRARLAQALRTEQLRSRIATDLHDDIGSSLSQIAILAEVARRRAGAAPAGITEPLASIATTSRDLVDAMSDIVWAVNPRTDSLSDLTRRMHRFAEETLGAAEIGLTFTAPPSGLDRKLGADLRRELYLILKESVNNIARHSGASWATVELTCHRNDLRLAISDDGRGFDPQASVDGNGIASMRKRAAAFGGQFAIESSAGRGTRVTLRASIRT